MQVDLLGVMVVWGIQLNAVSLVNLAMALGISVEFCAHFMHAFVVAPGSRPQRTAAALVDVGASVLSGITLTKFVGACLSSFHTLSPSPSAPTRRMLWCCRREPQQPKPWLYYRESWIHLLELRC